VKRLAASLEIAARGNGFKAKQRRAVVVAAVASYREAMREFAGQGNLAVWYARLDVDQALREARDKLPLDRSARAETVLAKARTPDSMPALDKLTTEVDGQSRIRASPPPHARPHGPREPGPGRGAERASALRASRRGGSRGTRARNLGRRRG